MAVTLNKKEKIKPQPKGVTVFQQMLQDKRSISKHLQKGGTFKELKEKGYRFATV